MATFRIHCIGTGESRNFRAIDKNNIITTEHVRKMYIQTLVSKGYKLADIVNQSLESLYDMKQRHKRWSPFMSKN